MPKEIMTKINLAAMDELTIIRFAASLQSVFKLLPSQERFTKAMEINTEGWHDAWYLSGSSNVPDDKPDFTTYG